MRDKSDVVTHGSGGGAGTVVMMLVSTTWNVAGHRVVETRGDVFGLTVRSRSVFANIAAAIRALFGGEIRFYTNLLEDSRNQAIGRMIAKAEELGANAVLSMRFDASQLSGSMTEIVAYGTAAVIAPTHSDDAPLSV